MGSSCVLTSSNQRQILTSTFDKNTILCGFPAILSEDYVLLW